MKFKKIKISGGKGQLNLHNKNRLNLTIFKSGGSGGIHIHVIKIV